MTALEQLEYAQRWEWFRGWLRGCIEGREDGIYQGERAMLLRLVRKRFGNAVDNKLERRVAEASAEELEMWSDRVVSAATLAELFAE